MFQEFCPLQGQWGQVLVRTTNKKNLKSIYTVNDCAINMSFIRGWGLGWFFVVGWVVHYF